MRALPFLLLGQLANASLLRTPPAPPPPPGPPALPSAVGLLLPPPAPPPLGADLSPPIPVGPAKDVFFLQNPGVDAPPGGPPPPQPQGDPGGPRRPAAPARLLAGECRLMGPFAIVVQLGLGGLALLALVYKRWRERPQRPVRIWLFDVSKQVFGAVLVHVANVFLSLLTSGRLSMGVAPRQRGTGGGDGGGYTPNPCSFYLLNLAIDTTAGIPILLFFLHLTTALAARTPLGQPPASIQSGHYGRPPRARWWLKQSLLYGCGLFCTKACVLALFLALPWLVRVGDWALRWTEGDERLQIVFVMMLFPLLMNALQYYIIDSYIMAPPAAAAADDSSVSTVCGEAPYVDESESDDGDDDGDDDRDGDSNGAARGRLLSSAVPEYDPDVDGDSPTIIGSSISQWSARTAAAAAAAAAARNASLPKDLSPPP